MRNRTHRKGYRANGKSLLLTLCHACARQFYDSGEYNIYRANQKQAVKDTCNFCGQKWGWDYLIENTAFDKGRG